MRETERLSSDAGPLWGFGVHADLEIIWRKDS